MGAEAGIRVANVFHAGDGNLHPLILFDGREPGALERAEALAGDILRLCIALGGSITGEHGVGVEKRDYLPLMFSEDDMALMRRLRGRGRPGGASPTPARCSRPRRIPCPRDARRRQRRGGAGGGPPGPRILPGRRRHEAGAVDAARRRRRRPRPLLPARHRRVRPRRADAHRAGRHAGRRGRRRAGGARPAPAVRPAPARGAARRSAAWSPPGPRAPARSATAACATSSSACGSSTGPAALVAGGGKVVKNAAGFDLPKLMVGSMGRLGAIVQLSLKVFPRPRATTTLVFELGSTDGGAGGAWRGSARGPLDLDALDLEPPARLLVRLGGDPEALAARAARVAAAVPATARAARRRATTRRCGATPPSCAWMPPAQPRGARGADAARSVVALQAALAATGARARYSLGANVAWIAWPEERPLAELDAALRGLGLAGMVADRRPRPGGPLLGAAAAAAPSPRACAPPSTPTAASRRPEDAARHPRRRARRRRARPWRGAIESCVHCGFCLPTCPTYVTMGEEMDSPRGRIFLMKEVLEGELELETALPLHRQLPRLPGLRDRVPVGRRLRRADHPVPRLRRGAPRTAARRTAPAARWSCAPCPTRGASARRPRAGPPGAARVGAAAARVAGGDAAAAARPPARGRGRCPRCTPAEGARRARVALLAGCAQQVLAPDISWATLRVLARNGVETVVPRGQGCCGALAMHTGAAEQARRARAPQPRAPSPTTSTRSSPTPPAAARGCTSTGCCSPASPSRSAAERLAERVVDVSVFLADLGLRGAARRPRADRRRLPRRLPPRPRPGRARRRRARCSRAIGGVTLVEPAEWELCCGSAGTYNVEKPDTAAELGARKARNLLATGRRRSSPPGNIGCLTQVQTTCARSATRSPCCTPCRCSTAPTRAPAPGARP